MKHIVLILNYNNYQETINYINSIYKYDKVNAIVVVDNGSKTDNFLEIEKFCLNKEKIHLIKSDDNLGFSKGNNLGYDYCIDNFGDDIMLHCSNSDINLLTENFYEKVEKIYLKEKFSVLGPNILTRGIKTSPLVKMEEETFITSLSNFSKGSYYINYYVSLILDIIKLEKTFHKIYRKINKKATNKNMVNDNEIMVLQGSYIIYSPIYIQRFGKVFVEKTFLYCEEYFLFYVLHNLGVKVMYSDEIKVDHFHGRSTTLNISKKYNLIKDGFNKLMDFEDENEFESYLKKEGK